MRVRPALYELWNLKGDVKWCWKALLSKLCIPWWLEPPLQCRVIQALLRSENSKRLQGIETLRPLRDFYFGWGSSVSNICNALGFSYWLTCTAVFVKKGNYCLSLDPADLWDTCLALLPWVVLGRKLLPVVLGSCCCAATAEIWKSGLSACCVSLRVVCCVRGKNIREQTGLLWLSLISVCDLGERKRGLDLWLRFPHLLNTD